MTDVIEYRAVQSVKIDLNTTYKRQDKSRLFTIVQDAFIIKHNYSRISVQLYFEFLCNVRSNFCCLTLYYNFEQIASQNLHCIICNNVIKDSKH